MKNVRVILGHASYYGIHDLFPEKTPRYIIFFRDPADRIVSAYNFEMRTKTGRNLDFWKWYKMQSKNEVVHFSDMKYRGLTGTKADMSDSLSKLYSNLFKMKIVAYFFQRMFTIYSSLFKSSKKEYGLQLKNAKALLDKCWHIGFINNLDQSLKLLFKEIGLPTKWKNTHVTPKTMIFFKLDEKARKKIYDDNKYDKELFDYALSLKNMKNNDRKTLS